MLHTSTRSVPCMPTMLSKVVVLGYFVKFSKDRLDQTLTLRIMVDPNLFPCRIVPSCTMPIRSLAEALSKVSSDRLDAPSLVPIATHQCSIRCMEGSLLRFVRLKT